MLEPLNVTDSLLMIANMDKVVIILISILIKNYNGFSIIDRIRQIFRKKNSSSTLQTNGSVSINQKISPTVGYSPPELPPRNKS